MTVCGFLGAEQAEFPGVEIPPDPSRVVSIIEEPTGKSHDLHDRAHPLTSPTWPAMIKDGASVLAGLGPELFGAFSMAC